MEGLWEEVGLMAALVAGCPSMEEDPWDLVASFADPSEEEDPSGVEASFADPSGVVASLVGPSGEEGYMASFMGPSAEEDP